MLKIKNILAVAPVMALSLAATGAMAANSSWAVISFDQAQSGARAGNVPYQASQIANLSTATQKGPNAVAESDANGNQTLTMSNGSFAQRQNGNVGSALTWQTVPSCGNPSPCSVGGFTNVNADTTGKINQAQQSDDSTSQFGQNATVSQFSKVGDNASSLDGTISQSNLRVVPPAPARRIDPVQTQSIVGETHSEGTIFFPLTTIFTNLSHFVQTISVTAENILNF